MHGKFVFRMAVSGAIAGAIIMQVMLALSKFGSAGWIASSLLAAAGGASLICTGARWYARSIIDDGTGLYNRRYLFQRLEQELGKIRRSGAPLSLAVIDIDDFRRYNNRYGHIVGDEVLLLVARTLRSSVRKGDIVGRWGGEEFALILPGTDAREALAVTERVRRKISELAIELTNTNEHVTISGGVAVANNRTITMRDLVQRADHAMYNAKKQKNKILPFIEAVDPPLQQHFLGS